MGSPKPRKCLLHNFRLFLFEFSIKDEEEKKEKSIRAKKQQSFDAVK